MSEAEDDWGSTSQDPNSLPSDGNSEATCYLDRPSHTQSNEDNGPLADITGKYLLKVKEENRLTQTTIQNIAKATSELFSVACNRLKRKVKETLKDANVETMPGIKAAFEEVISPFEDLDAKWMFPEFTRDKLPYVVCTYSYLYLHDLYHSCQK